jgi:hypothetical protein
MSRNKTSLVGTGGGSKSLRTTVPSWIVEQFRLKAGKKLLWRLETGENGELYIKVRPER